MRLSVLLPRFSSPGVLLDLILPSTVAVALLSACGPAIARGGAPAPGGGGYELLGVELEPASPELLGPTSYDLPVAANTWVQAELEFLVTERRDVVRSWMDRGSFYADFVHEVLREEGIPTDLYHLAMIESGYVPVARSRAGAMGMWQFMPATGREVGLRVDASVDERMDPVRSTRAAARHLRSLYRIHGDWTLAAAAYNAGSGRISRGLQRFRADNFWDLAVRGDLAAETQRYVPRLFAMTIIGRDPQRFGFTVPVGNSGFAFDSVHVDSSISTEELAAVVGVDAERIAEMNPHLINGTTPAGGYWVWVPEGSGEQAQRAYLAWSTQRERGDVEYTVRWGDTLGDIAQLTGVAVRTIRELNPGVDFDRLRAGSTIRLPVDAARTLTARPTEVPIEELPEVAEVLGREPERRADVAHEPEPDGRVEPPVLSTIASPTGPDDSRPTSHRVAPGETLSEIAGRYGITVADLQRENGLSGSVIVSGQRLRIPVESGDVDAPAPAVSATTLREHRVEAGETLSEIAERFGTTVRAIENANGISRGSVIVTGQSLLIPQGVPEPSSAPERSFAEHTVESGETLYSIARRYGATVSAIQEQNDLGGTVIRPGQRLRVPLTPENATGGSQVEAASVEHVVRPGETLWGIARRYDSSVEEITAANQLGDRPIVPGQRLTVPRSSASRR